MTLAGKHILVTAGPTHEPIDPVRVIANRSSGRQGFAIAAAAAARGARVTLVAGPVALETPAGVERIDVETAAANGRCGRCARCPAMPRSWSPRSPTGESNPRISKLKKTRERPSLNFTRTRDILAELAASPKRPRLLIGFAAETEDVIANAIAKRERKGADWIVANDVSGDVMGGTRNRVNLISGDGVEDWPEGTKEDIAARLVERIAGELS